MPEGRVPFRVQQVVAFASVYLVWGSTYLAIRFAVETLPPFTMAGVRFLVAGAILGAWAWMRSDERPTAAHWRSATVVGALLLLGGNGAVVWAEQRLASGLTALIIGTEPLWIALFLWLGWREGRPRLQTVAGLLLGFAGIALIAAPTEVIGGAPVHLLSAAAVVFACVSWAGGSIYARSAPRPAYGIWATALQMLCGGALLLAAGVVTGELGRVDPAAVSLRSALALGYLIVFGSLIAFSAYSFLVRTTSPTLVSTYAYVNPLIAVLLGWWLAGEPVGWKTLAAAAMIVGSVVMVSLPQRRRRVRPVEDAKGVQDVEEAAERPDMRSAIRNGVPLLPPRRGARPVTSEDVRLLDGEP